MERHFGLFVASTNQTPLAMKPFMNIHLQARYLALRMFGPLLLLALPFTGAAQATLFGATDCECDFDIEYRTHINCAGVPTGPAVMLPLSSLPVTLPPGHILWELKVIQGGTTYYTWNCGFGYVNVDLEACSGVNFQIGGDINTGYRFKLTCP